MMAGEFAQGSRPFSIIKQTAEAKRHPSLSVMVPGKVSV